MKKLILMLSMLSALTLLLCACNTNAEKAGNTPSEELIIEGFFGADVDVPDFLSGEQADLYRKATVLYYIFETEPSSIDRFPLKDGQDVIPPNDGDVTTGYITAGNVQYGKSIGRYREYAEFEKMVLSVFTPDFFEMLNGTFEVGAFIESNGGLYWLAASGSTAPGYNPRETPDTFQLISSSENEIKFSVTGCYTVYEDGYETEEVTSETFEIAMTLTNSGWRFTLFTAPGVPRFF
jgi:hypothetical protein